MRRVTIVVIIALILTPAASVAQRAELIAQGAKVRVSTRGKMPYVGHLDSLNATTLAMSRSERNVRAPSFVIPRDQVLNFEVRQRSHALGALQGGVIGFLAGVVTGAALGVITLEDEEDCFIFCTATDAAMMGGLVGAIVVTPIGIVGGAVRGVDRWRRVDPASVRMP